MRICFLSNAKSTHTYRWIYYFAVKGHEVHLLSYEEFPFKSVENLTVHTMTSVIPEKLRGFTFLTLFIHSFQVKKLVRSIKPDIVHAHYMTDYGLLGYFVGYHPYVLTLWGSDILIDSRKLFSKIMAKFILNSSNLITCDSNDVKNECLKYIRQQEKVEVIQWGVDLSTFREKRSDRKRPGSLTLLSNREFEPNYNIDCIIKSICLIIKKYPDIKVILKNFYGTREPELRQLARSLNVTKYIEFVNKKMDDNEIPEMLYRADIFISVPSSDGSSMALLEAMACGLPVIVSDLPANREWITDGWNGFFVPVRNSEELASSIIRLIEKPDLMQMFGERNAQLIRDRADRAKHMAHMEKLYQHLLVKN